MRIEVLDHGYVTLDDHMGSDLSIVRNARVIEDAEWRGNADVKLIDYLMKNRHTSPFEVPTFNFFVKAPIFVFRQWHRHRTWAYNERSARYEELPEEFYVPRPEHIGTQSKSNHQSRDMTSGVGDAWVDVRNKRVGQMKAHNEAAFLQYKKLLADGVPRELARSVLPFATYSVMFAKTDLHNLFHFLSLRMSEHAQYEIRVYADAIFELIKPIVPHAARAFWVHTLKRDPEQFDVV